MQNLSQDDVNAIAEAVARGLSAAGVSGARPAALGGTPEEQQRQARRMIEEYRKANDMMSKVNRSYNTFNNLLKGTVEPFKDATDEIERLEQAIKSATDQKTKEILQDQQDRVKFANNANKTSHAIVEFGASVTRTGVTLARDLFNASVAFANSVASMRPGQEFQAFGGLLSSVTRAASGVGSALGGAVNGFGESISKLGIVGKIAAVPIQLLGTAAKVAAGVLGTVLPPVIELIANQAQATIAAFNNVSKSGVVLAGGMTEMRNMATGAGLSMDSFGRVVAANTDALKGLGGSVSTGARRFADIQKSMLPFREGLLNLGITIDEQAQGILDYTNSLRGTGQLQNQSAQQIAEGTRQYLINLRLVSAITGEEAKKAQERALAASRQAAVQSKLAGMPREATEKFQALIRMFPGMEQAIQQMFLGGPVTGDLARVLSQMPETAAMMRNLVGGISDSGQNLTQYTDEAFRQMGDKAKVMANEAGRAGQTFGTVALYTGRYATEAEKVAALQRMGIDLSQMDAKAREKLLEQLRKQEKTEDPTTQAASKVAVAMNQIQILIEGAITKGMTALASVLTNNMGAIESGINKLGQLLGRIPADGDLSKIGDAMKDQMKAGSGLAEVAKPLATPAGTAVGVVGGALAGNLTARLLGSIIGRGLGGILGSVVPLAGTLLGGTVGALAGEKIGEYLYDQLFPKKPEARAMGGPVGRLIPYIVGERGPELFVPNVGGEIVPNKDMNSVSTILKSLGLENMFTDTKPTVTTTTATQTLSGANADRLLNEIKQILQDQTMLARLSNDASQEVTRVMSDLRNLQQQLVGGML